MDKVKERSVSGKSETKSDLKNDKEDKSESETMDKKGLVKGDEAGTAQFKKSILIRNKIEKINREIEDIDLKTREKIVEKGHKRDVSRSSM